MTDEPSPDKASMKRLNWPRWSDDFERRRELELRDLARKVRRRVGPRLKALGIEKVVGGYSGVEGSGSMHDIECVGSDGKPVQIADELRQQLVAFLYEFAPDGYEFGDGGQGDVTLDLASGRIEVEHEQAVIHMTNSYDEYAF